MTKLLEKAFAAAARLTVPEQDALASALLADLQSESLIDQRIESDSSTLESLADEAVDEHRGEVTKTLEPDDL